MRRQPDRIGSWKVRTFEGCRVGKRSNVLTFQPFNVPIVLALVVGAVLILACGMAAAGPSEGSKSAKPESRGAAVPALGRAVSARTAASSKSQPLNLGAYEPSSPALDADVAKDTKERDEPVLVTVGSFIFKLAIVLGLAYVSIYALKRFTGLKNAIGGNRRRIKVIENANLGTNRSLHLIEVQVAAGGARAKTLLVGSTPSQISLITELAAEEVDSEQLIVDSGEPDRQPGAGFGEQLSIFMGAKQNTGDVAGDVAQMIRGSSTFLQEKIMQLGRLRRKLKDG
jgi:flagellar biogenesis protein FliO